MVQLVPNTDIIHNVAQDIMLQIRWDGAIDTLRVKPVQINRQTRIIPVIQHHQPCTQWKAIAHGHVMRTIINRGLRVRHVQG